MNFKTTYSMLQKQLGGDWHSHDLEARHHFTRNENHIPVDLFENTAYFWARFDAEYGLALAERLEAANIPFERVMGAKHHIPEGQTDIRIAPASLDAVKQLRSHDGKTLSESLSDAGLDPRPRHNAIDMKPARARDFLAAQLGGTWQPYYETPRLMKAEYYTAGFDLAYGEALVKFFEERGFRPDTTAHLDENRLDVHITPAQLRDIVMPLADTSAAKLGTVKYQLEEQLGLPHALIAKGA